jgi:hypothetical protein
MAEVIQVQLDIETKKAQKGVDNLTDEIVNLNKEIVEGNKETAKGLKGVEKASDKTAGGVKKIGGALKALGIGLIIAGFSKFVEVLNENQKVADFFSITFEALSLAFNDFFNFILSNTGAITNFFKAAFDDPVQNMIDFGIAIKENVIERIQSSIDTLGYLAEAVVKVFKGDFAGALDAAKNAGKELVDVVTGVDDSFDKTAEVVSKVAAATSNYVKETIKGATENINLAKTAELATVANQGLIEEYDRLAEEQRQLRDNEFNTIEERVAANNKLKEVLDEQKKLMLENANAILAAAQAQFNKNGNDENQLALLEAQNEVLAVQAQIKGFMSEQDSNANALKREELELNQSLIDGDAERQKLQRDFDAEQIEGEVLRLEQQKLNAEKEKEDETKRLEDKKKLYKEGTQAFADAQNELKNYSEESARNVLKIEKDLNKAKQQQMTEALGNLATLVGKSSKFGKAIAIVQAIRDTFAGANKALSASPPPFNFIAAAAVTAAGIANVKSILSTPDPTPPAGLGSSGGGGGSIPAMPSAPPAFNVVGQGGSSQLADAIGGQANQPMRAYVVSNDVTTAQGLERNIVEGATI